MFRERRPSAKLVAIGLALVLVSSLVGYVAGSAIRSPAQAVADSAPPTPTTLTEMVQLATVTRSVTFDGEVQPRDRTSISAPTDAEDAAASVLTRLPLKVGGKVQNGDVIAEVSGRPIIVLEGALPSYRTLSPGTSGPDVQQLQRALRSIGSLVDVDGAYGTSTAAAVQRLYHDHGYNPIAVGGEAVAAAQDQVTEAERALERDGRGADPVDRTYLSEDLDRARAELHAAQGKAGAQVTAGEIIFLRDLPATVATLDSAVGGPAEGVLMTLTAGPLVVRGEPLSADGDQITPGDHVRMLLSPSGEMSGRVTSSSVSPTTEAGGETQEGSQPPGRTYTIKPSRKLPSNSIASPVRVIVDVAASPKPGLTVPISAVSVSAGGDDTVTVVRGDRRRTVKVVPGFAGDGLVQIVPADPSLLVEGDLVVVGRTP